MKKTQKILYFIATLIEAGLLSGTCIFNHFASKKLGINRWVNFTSAQWEKNYPVSQIKIFVILLLVIFSVLACCLYLKQRTCLQKIVVAMLVVTCVTSVISIGYISFCSLKSMRTYYLICLMLVAASVIQLIKTFTGIKLCRNGE